MLLAIASVAAAAALCFALLNPKKTRHILRFAWYEYQFQIVGTRAVIEDHIYKKKNKLDEKPDRSGEVVVITGGARGIGIEVVKVLLECKMKVVMGVRSPDAARKNVEKLPGGSGVVFKSLDVSSLKSVRDFAAEVSGEYPSINVLLNNAGIMYVDKATTVDGFESQLATNYLGHFLLTHLLMPNLRRGAERTEGCSRVVNVSSSAHYPGEIFFDDINMNEIYVSSAAYAQSKLAQVMHARHLNRLLESEGARVRCYSVHPGVVNTELFNTTPFAKIPWFMDLVFKTPEQGAVSILYTCLSPRMEERGGLFVSNCRQGLSSEYSKNVEHQKRLFEMSCEMVGIKKHGVAE